MYRSLLQEQTQLNHQWDLVCHGYVITYNQSGGNSHPCPYFNDGLANVKAWINICMFYNTRCVIKYPSYLNADNGWGPWPAVYLKCVQSPGIGFVWLYGIQYKRATLFPRSITWPGKAAESPVPRRWVIFCRPWKLWSQSWWDWSHIRTSLNHQVDTSHPYWDTTGSC